MNNVVYNRLMLKFFNIQTMENEIILFIHVILTSSTC